MLTLGFETHISIVQIEHEGIYFMNIPGLIMLALGFELSKEM